MISYALAFHLKALTFSHDHYYSADQKIRGKIIIDHKRGEENAFGGFIEGLAAMLTSASFPSAPICSFSFKYFEI